MTDPATLLVLTPTAVTALALTSAAGLKGWRGWLELKRLERAHLPPFTAPRSSPAVRIEMADLKERVRKLEAIASGVDP